MYFLEYFAYLFTYHCTSHANCFPPPPTRVVKLDTTMQISQTLDGWPYCVKTRREEG